MKKQLASVLMAALAVGGVSFVTAHIALAEEKDADKAAAASSDDQAAASDKATQDKQTPAVSFPAGVKLKEEANKEDRNGVLKPLKTATQAALTKDGFDDLIERLVDQDRNRLGKEGITEKKFEDLNMKAQALREAWKAKYGKDFGVDRDEAFTHVATLVGEIEDPQAVAFAWPVAAVSPAAGEAVNAAAKEAGATEVNKESNLEKGRDVAIATIPKGHGLPALHASLIQELGGWKLDIPNNITGQQLHDNLLKHLNHLSDMQAKWPESEDAAALAFSHHILMGIYGVDAEPKADRAQADPATDDATTAREVVPAEK